MKHFLRILSISLWTAVLAWAAPEDFGDYRAKAARLEPFSDADYALGRELLAEMRQVGLRKKLVNGQKLFFTQCVSPRFMRLYFTERAWFDHSLFDNRLYYDSTPNQYKEISGLRNFRLLEEAGITGLGTWCTKKPSFALFDEAARKYTAATGNPMWNAITVSGRVNWYGKLNHEALSFAAQSQSCFRIGGKPAIFTYGMDMLSPQSEREFIAEIRKATGGEVVFIHEVGSLQGGIKGDPYHYYVARKCIPATYALEYYDKLTEYLEGCDGLDFWNRLTHADRSFFYEYYDDIVLPLFTAACAQPKFGGAKYYMQQVQVGYNGYGGSQTMSRNGTKTLRGYLELCRKYPVDFMLGAEWDETNEDTCLQPTVHKPMSSVRILRHYNSIFRNLPLTPLKGDDLSLPNLIVSHPYQFLLGRDFEVELLNVPDGSWDGRGYTVTCELLSEHGTVETPFQADFIGDQLTDHTFRIPSASLCGVRTLYPRLTITSQSGEKRVISEGLPSAVIRATESASYSWVCTPIRNVMWPAGEAKVVFRDQEIEGTPCVQASVEARFPGHPLNTFEATENGVDIYAWDSRNEFLQNDPTRRLYTFSTSYLNKTLGQSHGKQGLAYDIQIQGANEAIFFTGVSTKFGAPDYSLPFEQHPCDQPLARKSVARVFWDNWHISVPSVDVPKAVFRISGKRTDGPLKDKPFQWEVPLAKLGRAGVFAHTFEDGVQVGLEAQSRLARQALPLGTEQVKFDCNLVSDRPDGCIMFRAVSLDGRVWWSRPHLLGAPRGQTRAIRMYDEPAGHRLFQVDSSRVPVIRYRFDPRIAGDLLISDCGRFFNATLGGYSSTATGVIGMIAQVSNAPSNTFSSFKGESNSPAPQWEKLEDGAFALRFPGEYNSFINLPPSAIPQRAAYTLECEVLPEDVERDQIWLVERGPQAYLCGLCLRTEGGKFALDFKKIREERLSEESTLKTHAFSFGPQAGSWTRLVLRYEGESMTWKANDRPES
ncbi:MAG: hypothetical protein IJJ33_05495, partial [Victivallales bacterium]|nr:hypothetical protein [Victivallales bacterium]